MNTFIGATIGLAFSGAIIAIIGVVCKIAFGKEKIVLLDMTGTQACIVGFLIIFVSISILFLI